MFGMAFKVYCSNSLVFVVCRRGSFYRGIGYGFTVNEALRNMIFLREQIGVK